MAGLSTTWTNWAREMAQANMTTAGEPDDAVCPLLAFMLSFVLVGLTGAFGFIGNSLSIATLNRDRSNWKTVTHFLLTVLAAADIAFLIPVVVVIVLPVYCSYFTTHCSRAVSDVISYVEQYGWSVASAGHMTTVYVTVLVAFHRYVYVCRPYDTNRLSGIRRAKIQVLLVPIFALLFNIPRLFEYELGHHTFDSPAAQSSPTFSTPPGVFHGSGPSRRRRLNFTVVGQSLWFKVVYKNICFYLFMFIVPLGILLFVSFRLVQTLRRRKLHRFRAPQTSRQQENRDNKVTFVLIIVIVVFIVCQTPTVVQRLVLALENEEGLECGQPFNNLERFADFLVVFNSCVNFVVYVMFARKFRQILLADILHIRGGAGYVRGGAGYVRGAAGRWVETVAAACRGMLVGCCRAAGGSEASAELLAPQRNQQQHPHQQQQQQRRTQQQQAHGRQPLLLQLPEAALSQSRQQTEHQTVTATSSASALSAISTV